MVIKSFLKNHIKNMRRKDREITNTEIIREILSTPGICRIVMVDDGEPYLVPLNYGYKDNAIYIHSAPQGKKIEILRKMNRVCFEIEYSSEVLKHDLPCEWTSKYRSLIGYGTIEIITDFEKKKQGLDIIMAQFGKSGENVYNDKNVEAIVILKIKIRQISEKQHGEWDH